MVLIDWFTVIAQIINFLILIWLLRRFLYQPILNAMAERERKIAARLEEAEKQRTVATAEIETYRQKNTAFDQEREQMIRTTQADVAERRHLWLEQARSELEETRTRWQRALLEEKDSFLQTVRQRVGEQTYQVIRRALTDLADADLEGRLVHLFLTRLENLPDAAAQPTQALLQEETPTLTLNSSFDLDATQQKALRKGIITRFGTDKTLQFNTTPELICGLELVAPGHKIAWSLANYLDELEEALTAALADIAPATEEQGNG